MKLLMNLTLITFMTTLVACGSLGSKYNKEEVKKVKRIAVLSFAIYQNKPADNLGLGALTKGVSTDTTSENSPEFKLLAKSVYSDLSRALQKRLKKKVYGLSKVKSSSKYQSLYKDKMEGLRMGGYRGSKVELVIVDGIIDQTNFQGLPFAKKVEMAKSVGADAFVEFNASQSLEQGWGIGNLTGNGDFSMKTRSNITMYSIYSEEPIWRSQNVDGKVSRNSSEIKKGTQIKKLAILGHESAKSSIKAVIKTLNK